jgi:hypothetical protein
MNGLGHRSLASTEMNTAQAAIGSTSDRRDQLM